MTMANHSWEEETRKYLAEVQSELAKIDGQILELRDKRGAIAREVDAYQIALQSYLKRTGKQEAVMNNLRGILERQPNHQERIKRIAERTDGIIKVGPASDLLYNYRLIKSKTRGHAYRIVYGLMLDMVDEGIFTKIAPSTFKLTDGGLSQREARRIAQLGFGKEHE